MEIIYVDFLISMFPGRCYGTTLQYKKIIRAKITPLPPDTMLVITQPPAVITPSYQQCNGGGGGHFENF